MHRRLAMIVLAAALGCGPGSSGPLPPPPDSCVAPSGGSVDALELGAATAAELAGATGPFTALHDGDGVTLVHGGQGATMIGLVLQVTGGAAPSCLAESTTIVDSLGTRITSAALPLATYAQPDGTRLTHPLWLPGAYPSMFVVTVAAGGQSLTLHLHLL